MPPPPRTRFNSSQLVRCLADLDIPEVAEPRQTLAERLSPWLNWTDAISLAGLLNGGPAGHPSPASPTRTGLPAGGPAGTDTPAALAATDDLQRVRIQLAQSIHQSPWFPADEPGFAPCRRRYLALQQAMEAAIAPLRARVRAALNGTSSAARRLAALDAVLEQALGARERQLLATVPGLLQRHWHRHWQRQATDAGEAAAPPFGATVAAVMLAELDIRLQPVEGLIAALRGQGGGNTQASAAEPA
ncbi:MAG: DUF3348 domain-containing protein [Leptothrix sp. (in: Bacteria)]|nr:DUF3348 domain-containing protein [Leptothrix sp. (in: b-proteobacteria)]